VSATDVLAAVLGIHSAVTVGILLSLIRTREKVTRLEEWVRLQEKRLNGMEGG